jgi:hypothetical protein
MAHAGQVLSNPVSGETIEFLQTAADTGGELLAIDLTLTPDGHVPGTHVHPVQEERFEVLSGTMSLLCQWLVAVCGIRRRVCLSGAGHEVGGGAGDRGGRVVGVDVVVRARVLIGVGGAEEFPDASGEVAFEAAERFFA